MSLLRILNSWFSYVLHRPEKEACMEADLRRGGCGPPAQGRMPPRMPPQGQARPIPVSIPGTCSPATREQAQDQGWTITF